MQTTLFEASQHQFIDRSGVRGYIDQGIEIRVFDFELDKMPLRRM
jgi:hypothetical protein